MEEDSKTSEVSISISSDKNKMAPDNQNYCLPMLKKRKRSSGMHLLKVVLYMLSPKSSKSKTFQNTVASSLSWKGLVGSMRPMHLQSNQSPSPSTEAKPAIMLKPESMPVGEQNEEAINPPLSSWAYVSTQSPASSISASSSESDLSRYESPLNQEIHIIKPCGEITEDECWYDDDAGDEMIDAKAEEFIAHFYQQMRLQNLNLS